MVKCRSVVLESGTLMAVNWSQSKGWEMVMFSWRMVKKSSGVLGDSRSRAARETHRGGRSPQFNVAPWRIVFRPKSRSSVAVRVESLACHRVDVSPSLIRAATSPSIPGERAVILVLPQLNLVVVGLYTGSRRDWYG